jgi:Ca2+-binding EF-hand superfamily protein
MINRRFLIGELCAYSLLAAFLPFASSTDSFAATSPLAGLDKDNDGTVDVAEAKDGAASVFDKLEKDADATLDPKEIGSRLSKKEFNEADTDHDGTLTKDEYLAFVEKRFAAADADGDGTLDAKELHSKTGRTLLRLIR